jgi:SAM-dependent methyltransferase
VCEEDALPGRERWRRAQAYELDFWKRYEDALPDHTGALPLHLDFVLATGLDDKRVLEVGCGPMGVIYFTPGATRIGIDPLAGEYLKHLKMNQRGVQLLTSMGEHLPLASASFDVVIIGNVLDHVNDPYLTLDEIHRVLRPGGQIILWMHIIPKWLLPFRNILDAIDGGHPHHMTEAEARTLIRRSSFAPECGHVAPSGLGWRSGWKAALGNIAMRNLMVKGRAGETPPTATNP